MQVAIQPCGDSDAQEHYVDTIANKVPLSRMQPYLDESAVGVLQSYGKDSFAVWGVTRGNNDVNFNKWNRLEEGALVLLYRQRRFFASGYVAIKFVNEPLANDLWGVNQSGNTWECVFVLIDVRELELDVFSFNKAVEYAPTYIVQGFNVLSQEKSERVAELLELSEDKFFKSTAESEDKLIEQLALLKSTDANSITKTRKESGIFRRKLFPNNKPTICAVCGKEYPAELMVAAHIKMRASCSEEERLDINVVMPACKFGCDELYEKGFIIVDHKGLVVPSTQAFGVTNELDEFLDAIRGNKVIGFSSGNELYFEWHRRHRIYNG